ncbi:MAG: hypothetical protein ACFUZC_21185 [Chthoniobacteraceae bacterium]
MSQPYIVPSTARRDWLIGLAAGALFLGAVIYVIMNLSGGLSGSTLNGTVVAKHFTPQPEDRITIGKRGLDARHSEGEYVLECVAKGRSYLVTVDKQTYETKAVGDPFVFSRPLDESTPR